MKRKQLEEEKALRKYLKESVTDDYPNEFQDIRQEWGRLITALVRAKEEDCIRVYYDWLDRPIAYRAITFLGALRKGMRWHVNAGVKK